MSFKKILAYISAMVICCGVVATPQVADTFTSIVASAEDEVEEEYQYNGSCGENVTFSFDESTGTLTISGTGDMEDNPWYNYSENIKRVIIEDGIISIADYAFYGCTSLTDITIPDGVTYIGAASFYDCTSLTEVNIPDGVIYIGDIAFYGCISLTDITIPDSVAYVGDGIFDNTPFIESFTDDFIILGGGLLYKYQGNDTNVTIPDGVTFICSNAFRDCTSLTEVTMPDSVISIGDGAFVNCTSLKSINIPDIVASIGDSAFANCTSLTEVNIPDSVISIGNETFFNCKSLTSITIPDSVAYIGKCAFADCVSLTEVNIPDSVISIDNMAFDNTPFIENITDDFIILGNNILYKYQGNDTNVTIPDGITFICSNAFRDCTSLTEVTIPNGITSIGDMAFYECTSLTKVTIPDSVTYIGDMAFGYYFNEETSEITTIEDFTIYGVTGSEAERYATENELNFVAIEEENTSITDVLNLKKYILGITTDGTSLDFNGDGSTNILDLVVLKQKLFK